MSLPSVFKTIRQSVRTHFVTGLLVAVPFAVTIACLAWLWKQIDPPLSSFFHFVTGTDSNEGPWSKLYYALIHSKYKETVVPLIGFVLIVFAVTALGVVMRSVVGRMVLKNVEAGVGRLPLIGMLYGSVKQLGGAFISQDGKSKFQRAVAVQFPYPGAWAIGFVTGPGDNVLRYVLKDKNPAAIEKMLTVFVPTSPLPTAGFTLVVAAADTMELDMSVQDALKLVVSGGMLTPIEIPRPRVTEVKPPLLSPLAAHEGKRGSARLPVIAAE